MGRHYSLDLRVRVAVFVEAGHSCRAARHFGVSDRFAIRLVQHQTESGSPAPARQGQPCGQGKLAPYESYRVQTVEAEPAIAMPELAARFLEHYGIMAAPAMVSRFFLRRRGFTYEKSQMPRNAHAPTFVRSAGSGQASVSAECSKSRIGWCFWTRPSSTPR
jgi:transposase